MNGTIGSKDADGVQGGLTAQRFVMNVAIDLRLVNSRTQEVIDMASYQKQVRGVSVDLGLTGGDDKNAAILSGGRGAMEPLQAAVRTLVERGVFEMTASFYGQGLKQSCLPPEAEPQGPPPPRYASARAVAQNGAARSAVQ